MTVNEYIQNDQRARITYKTVV